MNKVFLSTIVLGYLLFINTTLNGQQNKDSIQTVDKNYLPIATICSRNSGMIDKDTLIKAESLICSEKNYEIISFTMFRISGELNSKSNFLTEEMKKCIGEMRSGNKLSFFDIKAKTPDGKTKSLSPIILKIK
jgi:hypothetical protein